MKSILVIIVIQLLALGLLSAKPKIDPVFKLVEFQKFQSWEDKKKVRYIKELRKTLLKVSQFKSFQGTYASQDNQINFRLNDLFSLLFPEAHAAESDLFDKPFTIPQLTSAEVLDITLVRQSGQPCIYAGNVITYKGKDPMQCYPSKAQNQFDMGNGKVLKCASGLRMCNPLLFGIKGSGSPHCVSRATKKNQGLTDKCNSISSSPSDVVKFLKDNADAVRARWNKMRDDIAGFCVKTSNPKVPFRGYLQAKECEILESRMAALYKIAPDVKATPAVTYFEEFPQNCKHLEDEVRTGDVGFCDACAYSTRHGFPASGRWMSMAQRAEELCGKEGLAKDLVRAKGACQETEYFIFNKEESPREGDTLPLSSYDQYGISDSQMKARFCGGNFESSPSSSEINETIQALKEKMVKELTRSRSVDTGMKPKGNSTAFTGSSSAYIATSDFVKRYKLELWVTPEGAKPPKLYEYEEFLGDIYIDAFTDRRGENTLEKSKRRQHELVASIGALDKYFNGNMKPALDVKLPVNDFNERKAVIERMKSSEFLKGMFKEIKDNLQANNGKLSSDFKFKHEKFAECEKAAATKLASLQKNYAGDCEMKSAGNPPKGEDKHFEAGQVYVKAFKVNGKPTCEVVYGKDAKGYKIIRKEDKSNEYQKASDKASFRYLYCPEVAGSQRSVKPGSGDAAQ